MALQKKSSNSTRTIIIGLVIVIVAGVGYLLYQQFFGSATGNSVNPIINNTRPVVTNFGESILNDPRYTSLKSYDVTTNADANTDGGQINPFH